MPFDSHFFDCVHTSGEHRSRYSKPSESNLLSEIPSGVPTYRRVFSQDAGNLLCWSQAARQPCSTLVVYEPKQLPCAPESCWRVVEDRGCKLQFPAIRLSLSPEPIRDQTGHFEHTALCQTYAKAIFQALGSIRKPFDRAATSTSALTDQFASKQSILSASN